MKPASSWMLVHGLVSAVPQQELPIFFFFVASGCVEVRETEIENSSILMKILYLVLNELNSKTQFTALCVRYRPDGKLGK